MSDRPRNTILEQLVGLGLSSEDAVEPFADRVRDRDDVKALRCRRSGVIFLDRTDHVDVSYYEQLDSLDYWNVADRSAVTRQTRVDDDRRMKMISPLVLGRAWLDVGTELGGVLDLGQGIAARIAAVEPQGAARRALADLGYETYRWLVDAPDESFDVITLFHVYEHVTDPLEFLFQARRKLVPGGRICIEVPHARDVLLTQYGCEAFKHFTLWSEHLILHTRESLARFIAAAGFVDCSIKGVQRYGLANHLHWLAKAAPGGHVQWAHLAAQGVDEQYEALLAATDATDTIVAWARAPGV